LTLWVKEEASFESQMKRYAYPGEKFTPTANFGFSGFGSSWVKAARKRLRETE